MDEKDSKKSFTLQELCSLVGGRLKGDPHMAISGVNGIKEARPGEITFLANPKYLPYIASTRASAIIVDKSMDQVSLPAIVSDNPYLAFSMVLQKFAPPPPEVAWGIDPQARVAESAVIPERVAIGPFVVVCEKANIGANSVINAGCFIGPNAHLGKDCCLYPNVSVREGSQIGDRVIIHSGTVIGSDGFGYARTAEGHQKIPQAGIVIIEDDVEIGANVAVDRATMGATRIGRGSKIDNLVQIAHNVVIGKNSLIMAQVGISGSTVIGEEVTITGQVGIVGHISIGNRAAIGAQSGVAKDIPAGESWFGYPARPLAKQKRIEAFLTRYKSYIDRIAELEKKVAELENGQKTSNKIKGS
jgi:UDP-3-O-[3-hydroxymyristoyl] glucosamine N-acyltransferase